MSLALILTEDDAELVLLALQGLITDVDEDTSESARALETRIIAALPAPTETPAAGPWNQQAQDWPGLLAEAMESEGMVEVQYTDAEGRETQRRICPISLDSGDMLTAWCQMRSDIRHFRLDRIGAVRPTGEAYPRRLRLLRAEWQSVADFDDFFEG